MIALLLSGGVDSSVSLYRLKEQTKEKIQAFYLKIWLEDELSFLGQCPWEEDLEYARAVCDQSGIPLQVVPLQKEYFKRIVLYVVEELKAGRTPSPDVLCNQQIKFGAFWDRLAPEYQQIATGHYGVVEEIGGKFYLKRSPDPVKDQSYFLSQISYEQLSRLIFPIGSLYKEDVRNLAREYNLPNRNRKDSQGICFLGKIPYNDFIGHYLGEQTGEIIDRNTGKVLGEHRGYWYHTIGQRKGLGLGGGPWYVTGKDLEKNIVYVQNHFTREDHWIRSIEVEAPNWFHGPPEGSSFQVKLRHGPDMQAAEIHPQEEGAYSVELDKGDRGIAPGQFCVFYKGEICLGSGRIR